MGKFLNNKEEAVYEQTLMGFHDDEFGTVDSSVGWNAWVPKPLFISARLMAALRVEDSTYTTTLHVADDGEWAIDVVENWSTENRYELHFESDRFDAIQWGAGGFPGYVEAMRTLLSFMGACAESGPDGESGDLFAPNVAAWLWENGDVIDNALAMLDYDEASQS